MADTISASTTAGQYLLSTLSNPVIVEPGVVIQNTAGLGVGIESSVTYNWSITNYGTVIGNVPSGTLSSGILLDSTAGVGGVITNKTGAYIFGSLAGIFTTAPTTVVNTGKIVGSAAAGIVVKAAGIVTNAGTGVLQGYNGLYSGGTTGSMTVVNTATIAGSGYAGVLLRSGGAVTNTGTGVIEGGRDGIVGTGTAAPLAVINGSTIIGSSYTGVLAGFGGALINQAGGYILGAVFGARIVGSVAVVDNGGTIVSTGTAGSVGVLLDDGGSVTNNPNSVIRSQYIGVDISTANNASSGTVTNYGSIYGRAIGVQAYSAPSTVTNSGSIGASATGTFATGVLLNDGGSVANSGVVTGNKYGVEINNAAAHVFNQGTISNSYIHFVEETISDTPTLAGIGNGAGVALQDGGFVTNAAGGRITSTWMGVRAYEAPTATVASTILNQGLILAADTVGDGAAVWFHTPGLIVNGPSAFISGGAFGVVAYSSNTTLINHGSVYATQYAFRAANPNNTNQIVMYPGASFTGVVDVNDTIGVAASTLELASASSAGTVTDFGSQYRGFTNVQLDSGATWNFGGTVSTGQTINMMGTHDSLTLENPEAMNGTLADFVAGDTIILAGVTDATGLSLNADVLTVFRSGNPNLTFDLAGSLPAVAYTSVVGATDITIPCFAAGTMIRTPAGDVAVETLKPGTQVVSTFGGVQPVIWVGQRRIDCRRHPKPTLVWPIQIEANAFGSGLPATDLRVSPDHSLYIDGVLIPPRHLVNGDTIRQVPVDTIEYFHVELIAHDIILANNLPAESYLEIGDRSNFADSAVMRLFPDFSTQPDGIAALWEAKGCAPLVVHGPALDAIKARLAKQTRRAA